MFKLLLLVALGTLGYRFFKHLGAGRRRAHSRSSTLDRGQVVDADFEELED